jgi:transmembrane sensor
VATEWEPTASVFEQAAQWWELLDGDSASNSDHREFGEWVARSPERVEAFLQTARLVKAAKSPGVKWPKTSAEVLIRDAKASRETVLPFFATRIATPVVAGEARHPGNRIAWAAAAVLFLGVGLTLSMLETPEEYTTALGEQRSVLLADGSRVTLNTASTVEVKMHKSHREIRLVRGEALFEVAHDASRPFIVRAGNARLKDMGTQFNVDMRSSATTVTVVEGKVDVESAMDGSSSTRGGHAMGATIGPVMLGANERIVITPAGVGALQRDVNVAASVAWTQRQLMFEHRPLSEVAEEFNRYNRDRIEIESPELRRQEVTGVFEAEDPGSFVAFLSNIPGVEIREGENGAHIVAIRKKSKGAQQ